MKKQEYIIRQSEVIFPKTETRYSYVRNGSVRTSAVVLARWDDTVEVGLRTSKGKRGSGHISFPYNQIDKVIMALKILKGEGQTDKSKHEKHENECNR